MLFSGFAELLTSFADAKLVRVAARSAPGRVVLVKVVNYGS